MSQGKVVQIIGAVVDVEFPRAEVPKVYDALRPESGVERSAFQAHMEAHGVDTRMVWTGNALRQPAFRRIPHRAPDGGLPNTDRVMEQGLILPSNHSLSGEDIEFIWTTAEAFLP